MITYSLGNLDFYQTNKGNWKNFKIVFNTCHCQYFHPKYCDSFCHIQKVFWTVLKMRRKKMQKSYPGECTFVPSDVDAWNIALGNNNQKDSPLPNALKLVYLYKKKDSPFTPFKHNKLNNQHTQNTTYQPASSSSSSSYKCSEHTWLLGFFINSPWDPSLCHSAQHHLWLLYQSSPQSSLSDQRGAQSEQNQLHQEKGPIHFQSSGWAYKCVLICFSDGSLI